KSEVTKDMTYAKQQMDQYLADLKGNKKSLEQVLNEVKSDQRLVNGQYTNQSDKMVINLDGTRLHIGGALNIGSDLLKQIKKASGQKEEPYTAERLFTPRPAEYGLGDMTEITRGEQTFVGWQIIIVSESFDQNQGIRTDYEKYRED